MQKTAYEGRIIDWSSDVCSSDLRLREQVDACLARGDVAWESHVAESIWLTSPESAVLHAHYADLVVLGRVANATVDAERAVFSSLLLDSGRPLLEVPRGASWPSRRSEERRGGKECVSTCRSGWSRYK